MTLPLSPSNNCALLPERGANSTGNNPGFRWPATLRVLVDPPPRSVWGTKAPVYIHGHPLDRLLTWPGPRPFLVPRTQHWLRQAGHYPGHVHRAGRDSIDVPCYCSTVAILQQEPRQVAAGRLWNEHGVKRAAIMKENRDNTYKTDWYQFRNHISSVT